MDQSLLSAADKGEDKDLTLDDVNDFVESLVEDQKLEEFLRAKFDRNRMSFPLPPEDEVTALSKMQDGFLVGLKSGRVMLIAPPISRLVEFFQGPITGLFAASNFFILVASGPCVQAWSLATWKMLSEEQYDAKSITFVTGSMTKELIFLGFSNGDIEELFILNKESAEITVKFSFKKCGSESEVVDMKTNDNELWVAVRYKSNEFALWDHETGHMLYHFSFDGAAGMPASFTLGEARKLPRFFAPAEGWETFPHVIVFSSVLLIRMTGTAITKVYPARRNIEPDDMKMLAYAESLQKGYMPYFCGSYLISFTPPNSEKKKPSEKLIPEIEFDLGRFFTFVEKSEANNYIAFACEGSIEVYCLAAVESVFSHRTAGPTALSKANSGVYSRLGDFYNSGKEIVKPANQREMIQQISRDGKWMVSALRGGMHGKEESARGNQHFHRREESKFIDEGRSSFERQTSGEEAKEGGGERGGWRGRGGRGRGEGGRGGRGEGGRGGRGEGGWEEGAEGGRGDRGEGERGGRGESGRGEGSRGESGREEGGREEGGREEGGRGEGGRGEGGRGEGGRREGGRGEGGREEGGRGEGGRGEGGRGEGGRREGGGHGRRPRGLGAGRFRRGVGREAGDSQKPAEEGMRMQVVITRLTSPFGTLDLQEWGQKILLKVKFNSTCSKLALLFTTGFIIISLESQTIERTLLREFAGRSFSIKRLPSGGFLVVGRKWYQAVYPSEGSDGKEVKWMYDRMALLKRSTDYNCVAYSMSSTSVGVFTESGYTSTKSIKEGFERLKVLHDEKTFLACNDSGILIYKLPDLEKLIRIPQDYSVMVSKEQPYLFSLCTNVKNANAWFLDVWDLNIGLKTMRVYSGLKNVVENKLAVKGPGMWREPVFDLIGMQDTSRAVLKATWIFDLNTIAAPGTTLRKGQERQMYLYEENLEHHCIAWKRLVNLLRKEELTPEVLSVLIKPFNVNILHLLANSNQAGLLSEAVESGCPVLRSVYGTPLHIAIDRKARKCTNAILAGLGALRETDQSAFLRALYQIQDDLPCLVKDYPPGIADFLQSVIVPLPEEMTVMPVISPVTELPIQRPTNNLWVDSKSFDAGPEAAADTKQTVEYLICPFPVYVDLGTQESLSVLDILVNDAEDMTIHKTLFVKTLIDMKWNQLWWFIFCCTVLYWSLLVIMIGMMLHYFDGWIPRCGFVVLNTVLLLVEVLQMATAPTEYFTEYWNYVDLARTILSYLWALTSFEEWVTFFVVLLSLLRGITTFQTFSATRFYVRMIFVVSNETLSFLWVFFYSTLSFGLLFASVNPDPNNDFFHTWVVPYELNMGNFEVSNKGHWYWFVFMAAALVNVIIMLNLVVSILGDAYDKFQTISEAADVMGKAEVLFEYERMMWWKRESGIPQYLQICRSEGGAESGEAWAGKVEELKRELRKFESRLRIKINSGVAKMKEAILESENRSSTAQNIGDLRITMEERLNTIRELIKATSASGNPPSNK